MLWFVLLVNIIYLLEIQWQLVHDSFLSVMIHYLWLMIVHLVRHQYVQLGLGNLNAFDINTCLVLVRSLLILCRKLKLADLWLFLPMLIRWWFEE